MSRTRHPIRVPELGIYTICELEQRRGVHHTSGAAEQLVGLLDCVAADGIRPCIEQEIFDGGNGLLTT